MSMRIRVLLRAVVFSAMAAVSPAAFCATVTWDAGGGDSNWSNPSNWSTNSLPNSSDDVIITNVGGTVLVDMNPTVEQHHRPEHRGPLGGDRPAAHREQLDAPSTSAAGWFSMRARIFPATEL